VKNEACPAIFIFVRLVRRTRRDAADQCLTEGENQRMLPAGFHSHVKSRSARKSLDQTSSTSYSGTWSMHTCALDPRYVRSWKLLVFCLTAA
jgi:hypothetical protein